MAGGIGYVLGLICGVMAVMCWALCAAGKRREGSRWISVEERLPASDNYVLMSFENFSLPMIGRYEKDEDGGGAWYIGDCDEEDTCIANDLFVNAWMPLPKAYREENNEKD